MVLTRVVASLLVSLLSSAACSGGERQTKENTAQDYFLEFADILDRWVERIDATGNIDDEDAHEREGLDAWADAEREIGQLRPPPDIETAHVAFLDGVREINRFTAESRRDEPSDSERQRNFERFNEITQLMDAACDDLRQIATSYRLVATLRCNSDGE